jgi:peroxiredoxin
MAKTPSNMVPLGSPAPDFSLPDGRCFSEGATLSDLPRVSLSDLAGAPALLVMFICNHCPFVVHIREPLSRLVRAWQERGVAIVAIGSNDLGRYPQDGPEGIAALSRELELSFPYLVDADQRVATAYQAACTPDFFLYDATRRLVYRGQLDASRPGNDLPVTGEDLGRAIDAVLSGAPPLTEQRPSLGCNIKWRPGHEPPWFG